MQAHKRIIESDLFGIVERLKQIDDGYFVVYDVKLRRFEVHNSRQRGDTFSLSVPYPALDVRTVELVQKTRAENVRRLLRELEEENRRIEKKQINEAIDKACETVFDKGA